MNGVVSRAVSHRLFWPVVMLVVLLAINVIAVPGFLSITIHDGHLFGSLIDILRNGAPTLIIAVGMTLVIATRGIDLSVGAVCAISGALACHIHHRSIMVWRLQKAFYLHLLRYPSFSWGHSFLQ